MRWGISNEITNRHMVCRNFNKTSILFCFNLLKTQQLRQLRRVLTKSKHVKNSLRDQIS
jgi:hypothetical protein